MPEKLLPQAQILPSRVIALDLDDGASQVHLIVDVDLGGERLHYGPLKSVKLRFNIDNLFDRVYWERVGTATRSNYYGLPRSIMVTLRSSF